MSEGTKPEVKVIAHCINYATRTRTICDRSVDDIQRNERKTSQGHGQKERHTIPYYLISLDSITCEICHAGRKGLEEMGRWPNDFSSRNK